MIKDVMVCLDGTAADEVRLAAVADIAGYFESHIIALFLNVLPTPLPPEVDPGQSQFLLKAAREAGDMIEAALIKRLSRTKAPVEIRRFDVFRDAMARIAAREARAADTFVALRPNGEPREPENLIEEVLFGSGRHIFLVPDKEPVGHVFDNVLVAWDGSREAARALAEAMPYLNKAGSISVVSVVSDPPVGDEVLGSDAVTHLLHHGIVATLHRVKEDKGGVGATLIAEARHLKADLVVMGGYGHSRLREWLFGGATYNLLHGSPVPLIVSH